jgi:hypothetical protein
VNCLVVIKKNCPAVNCLVMNCFAVNYVAVNCVAVNCCCEFLILLDNTESNYNSF